MYDNSNKRISYIELIYFSFKEICFFIQVTLLFFFQTGSVYFRDSGKPSYIRWLNNEPNRPGDEPNLGIHVTWATDGILDIRPGTDRQGVLCEF